MDPWGKNPSLTANNNIINDKNAFEDNFKPIYQSLPDSKEYLAILETKLNKIKSDPDVLRQLSEKRADCMQSLLDGIVQIDTENELDIPVTHSLLLRSIAPERQALTHGELVQLINYEHIEENSEEAH